MTLFLVKKAVEVNCWIAIETKHNGIVWKTNAQFARIYEFAAIGEVASGRYSAALLCGIFYANQPAVTSKPSKMIPVLLASNGAREVFLFRSVYVQVACVSW